MHNIKLEELYKKFNSQNDGLNQIQIEDNRQQFGINELVGKKPIPLYKMILSELSGFLNILLLTAAIISYVLNTDHPADSIFILAIVLFNTFLSVYQEKNAKNAVNALKKISAPEVQVKRDGQSKLISSTELVCGDIVLLETGSIIPADIRLIESTNLKIDESPLTGESVPVDKDAHSKISKDAPIGDRKNMAFMSTTVTYGRLTGLVVNVGMNSEIGKIATMLNEVEDESTPLQQKIDKLGKLLGVFSIVIVGLIFVIGFIQSLLFEDSSQDIFNLFMISVSLAVAAIPEGLPTVITLVLSIGMRRMSKKQAIVKSLSAVETLGSVTVISSDKTGTLTQNKMMVTTIFDGQKNYQVTGKGYEFSGTISGQNLNIDWIVRIGALCNDAMITDDQLIGDPTELALLPLSFKNNQDFYQMREQNKRVSELPFDSDRKLMSTNHLVNDSYTMMVKGAPDELLKKCSFISVNGTVQPLNKRMIQEILKQNKSYANKALRVLGFAYKNVGHQTLKMSNESDLVFVGLVGMMDPPRPEVKEAIKICSSAGIRTIMITGDHLLTASAIGKELGILNSSSKSITGTEFASLSKEEQLEEIKYVNVFARVAPEHKVLIVKRLQESGEISSMTGDGVNDAPALKQADIGVAMGITGTDVSKEAADMVLLDDNFTTIVGAVEEGRVIYQNIRKFVSYLISCNLGEVLLIFVAMLIGWGSPLLAIQILWINLVTDSFPAFALGIEPKETNVMEDDPIDPKAHIIDRHMMITIGFQSVFLAIAVLLSYAIGSSHLFTEEIGSDYELGTTFSFITIVLGELFRTFSARSEHKSIFKMNPFKNKFVNISVFIGVLLMVLIIVFAPTRDLFRISDLYINNINYILITLGLGMLPLLGGELSKLFK
jgi:Ca2+-transporting ATPase